MEDRGTVPRQGLNKDDVDVVAFRRECRAFAEGWIEIQREEFKRLGVDRRLGQSLLTMDFHAEAVIAGRVHEVPDERLALSGLEAGDVVAGREDRAGRGRGRVSRPYQSDTIWVRFARRLRHDRQPAPASCTSRPATATTTIELDGRQRLPKCRTRRSTTTAPTIRMCRCSPASASTPNGKKGDANKAVMDALIAARAMLFARGPLKHSYPHSWRSKAP
jgi:hypothetical protein